MSLGVTFDSALNFDTHINNVRRKCFLQLRNLYRIRKFINEDCARTVIHAFVTSNLDYCNALWSGCTGYRLRRLQQIQNSCVRFVKRLPRNHHDFDDILRDLHWLPIRHRIHFKICSTLHKCLFGTAHKYLCDLIHLAPAASVLTGLRSQSSTVLFRPRSNFSSCGAFSIVAPRLWNALPPGLRSTQNYLRFRKQLKAFLFSL